MASNAVPEQCRLLDWHELLSAMAAGNIHGGRQNTLTRIVRKEQYRQIRQACEDGRRKCT